MRKPLLAVLLGGTASVLALATPAAAQTVPAPAQGQPTGQIATPAGGDDRGDAQSGTTESAERDASATGDIVVTAQRRAETLQSVPISVSAFTGEALERQQIDNASELQLSLPNITFTKTNFTASSFTIRGIGDLCVGFSCDAATGIHLNDMPLQSTRLFETEYFDLERVEVLRGPQGTLYGRNTIGGAIKYVTDKIGAEPEVKLRADLGSYDQADFIVSGETRLSDRLAVSAVAAVYSRGGYGENLTTGTSHYNKDVRAFRSSLEFSPTDTVFFRLSADRVRDESNARHGHRELAPSPDSVYDTNAGAGDQNVVQTEGVSLLAEWEASDVLTFKSITAYRDGFTKGQIDFDNLPQPLLDIPAEYNDHQFTQELQALYEGDRVQGVAGVYYLNSNAAGAFDTVISAINTTTFNGGSVDTRSYAVFADVSFDVTEAFSVSLDTRFSSEV